MDENAETTTPDAEDESVALIADLDPGDGADAVTGGKLNGDPCDGSEYHTHIR
jgi:hypothetical protein